MQSLPSSQGDDFDDAPITLEQVQEFLQGVVSQIQNLSQLLTEMESVPFEDRIENEENPVEQVKLIYSLIYALNSIYFSKAAIISALLKYTIDPKQSQSDREQRLKEHKIQDSIKYLKKKHLEITEVERSLEKKQRHKQKKYRAKLDKEAAHRVVKASLGGRLS